jgi:hypothetical protein
MGALGTALGALRLPERGVHLDSGVVEDLAIQCIYIYAAILICMYVCMHILSYRYGGGRSNS